MPVSAGFAGGCLVDLLAKCGQPAAVGSCFLVIVVLSEDVEGIAEHSRLCSRMTRSLDCGQGREDMHKNFMWVVEVTGWSGMRP